MGRSTIRKGDKGHDVEVLQMLLRDQGFFSRGGAACDTNADFDDFTHHAVVKFQGTHLGPDGQFLDADGIVGKNTWWALDHPDRADQESGLKALIPDGLSAERTRLLEIAVHEWQIGIKEDPSGSNWSTEPEGGIAKYTAYDPSKGGAAWCMRFSKWLYEQLIERGYASEFTKKAFKDLGRSGSCSKTRRRAQEMNDDGIVVWYDNDGEYTPIPGDMAIMDGHVFNLLRVSVNADGAPVDFNTVEGNSGNRVKCGYRKEGVALGFVNLFGDADSCDYKFEFGTLDAEDTSKSSTR